MSDKELKAFSAINQFVEALWEVYGDEKTVSPLALYRRLIEKITLKDVQSIQRFVGGFRTFFNQYETAILENKLENIPEGTCIHYGEGGRIYLEVQKFLNRADPESREAIRRHLINVSKEIDPSPLKLKELQKQMSQMMADNGNADAPEAQLMQNLIGTLQESMGDIQSDTNPMDAVMRMISNPALIQNVTKTMSGFIASQNGQIDPMKMMMNMAGMMQQMMPPPQQPEVSEVGDDEEDDNNTTDVPSTESERQALADIERQLENVPIVPKKTKTG